MRARLTAFKSQFAKSYEALSARVVRAFRAFAFPSAEDLIFLWQEWYLAHGDFLSGVSPRHSISIMLHVSTIITRALKGFHNRPEIKIVLLEAFKFCVPWLMLVGWQQSVKGKTLRLQSIS